MKLYKTALALLASFTLAFAAQEDKSAPLKWNDSTRDVYIDNERDQAAQVLVCDSPSRLALISPTLERAIVLDVNEGTVGSVPKDTFGFAADRSTATSKEGAPIKTLGKFTRVDGPVYAFTVDGKLVLIRAHPGATGEMTVDKLWETVPVWRAVMESYRANSKAVAEIKASHMTTAVTVVLGTWCPDSKNYVPRLIRALRDAGNDKIQVKLVGVDNQFHKPVAIVQPRRITNVPTVIIERDGHEIGRIVETPASKTIEEDLAAILNGRQLVHNGRTDRGPKLASGAYSYRDQTSKEFGKEEFELFSTAEGGYLVHSRITSGELTTEVFQKIDAKRRPSFAEITKMRGTDRTRTRFSFDGETMTARMRGSISGVVAQTIEVPARFYLSTPAMASKGWAFSTGDQKAREQVTGYISPFEFDKAMGILLPATVDFVGDESIMTEPGEFPTRHYKLRLEQDTCDYWVHTQLGIPLRAQATNGHEYVLTSLTISGK
ncbi:MAG: thioredoxin family protein [Blastocatellia bacterium]